jgi:hypothetical protein
MNLKKIETIWIYTYLVLFLKDKVMSRRLSVSLFTDYINYYKYSFIIYCILIFFFFT